MTTLSRRELPDMRLLQTFESAARHGNFTRAADELALTQSAVSRQVRELEEQIGHPLFERVRGRVIMTPTGETFLREVTQLLRMAEVTMRHAKAADAGHTLLTINALPTFAQRWLAPRLADYIGKAPNTSFDITTRKGLFNLAAEQCDLAIHFGDPNWPGARCIYLCSEIVVPVVGGALRQTRASAPEDLIEAPKLVLSERPNLWSDWFGRCGVDAAPYAHRPYLRPVHAHHRGGEGRSRVCASAPLPHREGTRRRRAEGRSGRAPCNAESLPYGDPGRARGKGEAVLRLACRTGPVPPAGPGVAPKPANGSSMVSGARKSSSVWAISILVAFQHDSGDAQYMFECAPEGSTSG